MSVHPLEIIGAEHDDDERQRRVNLDSLLDADEAVSAWLVRVFEDEHDLHHACPPRIERQPMPRVRDDAPRERARIDENLLYARCIGPSRPANEPSSGRREQRASYS
jgi:hypothetical protein